VSDPFAHLPHCGGYRVVYADPPWSFETWSHRGQGKGASKHYAVQGIDWLKSLPVGALAAPDAALFMWVVQPLLPQAFELMRAWGFEYKTIAYAWVKTKDDPGSMLFWDRAWDQSAVRLGLGYHTRSGMELCLLATRGKGYARVSKGERQVVHAGVREHSRKPDSIAASIVRLAEGPRVELFARTARLGFDAWGNDTDKFKIENDGGHASGEIPVSRVADAQSPRASCGPVGESGPPPPEGPDSQFFSAPRPPPTNPGGARNEAVYIDTEELLEIPEFLRRKKVRA
jgi:N6-adenosine-specific RNA methylase IME4